MGATTTMPAVILVVAILASIFATPTPCTAAVDTNPPPLVENLPTTVAAQDFVRTRCDQSIGRPAKSRMCYELLLPYATSINGSYNRATIAAVTVLVSKLTFFKGNLDTTSTSPVLGECTKVIDQTIGGGAKEALAKLGRLEAMGDDKVDKNNPDLHAVMKWIRGVLDDFDAKCREDAGNKYVRPIHIAITREYASTAYALIVGPRPYWDNSLPSPDGA